MFRGRFARIRSRFRRSIDPFASLDGRNGTRVLVRVMFATSLAGAALTFIGCEGERTQSSLHPAGPAAESVADLWWVMLAVLGLYTLGVFVLTIVAVVRRPVERESGLRAGHRFILVGGVILPTILLVPTLAYTVQTTAKLRMKETGLQIRVVGHRWWWEVDYPDHGIVTANELVIPVGEPVELRLASTDVIHSFWVPQLHGKMDMIPGKPSRFWLQADRAGIYRGQCAEYCGLQHAHMAFVVKAVSPAAFVRWLNAPSGRLDVSNDKADAAIESTQALTPTAADQAFSDGRRQYFRHGCPACHRIEGTASQGRAGPDLTLIASRSTLAAGTVDNTPENLLAWLAAPQSIKPGANMPATEATRKELAAIVSFLTQLRSAPRTQESEGDRHERLR